MKKNVFKDFEDALNYACRIMDKKILSEDDDDTLIEVAKAVTSKVIDSISDVNDVYRIIPSDWFVVDLQKTPYLNCGTLWDIIIEIAYDALLNGIVKSYGINFNIKKYWELEGK